MTEGNPAGRRGLFYNISLALGPPVHLQFLYFFAQLGQFWLRGRDP